MQNKKSLKIIYKPQEFSINLGGNATLDVNLSKVKMNDEQSKIIEKLLNKDPEITLEECQGDECPAQKHLNKDEFEKIRELKATLGSSMELSGLVADFCLKVVKVG